MITTRKDFFILREKINTREKTEPAIEEGAPVRTQEQEFRPVAEWVIQIQEVFAQGRARVLELARLVSTAKRKLHYGQWTELCKSRGFPFSQRKAEMLVAIWNGVGKLDAQSSARLPSAWNTLYYLARLPQPLLEQLIREGTIHPALTLREVKELWRQFKGAAMGSRPRVRQRVNRFTDFVLSNLEDWTPEERQWTRSALIDLADELHAVVSDSRTDRAATKKSDRFLIIPLDNSPIYEN